MVETVAEFGLGIQTIDRGSGILQIEQARAGISGDGWDCGTERTFDGKPAGPVVGVVVTNITITAVQIAGDSTRIRVVTNPRIVGGPLCASVGTFEQQLTQAVAARWRNLKGIPDPMRPITQLVAPAAAPAPTATWPFIGSSTTKRYYPAECDAAKAIPATEQVLFSAEIQAHDLGYQRGSGC